MELKELLIDEISGRYLTCPLPTGIYFSNLGEIDKFISDHITEEYENFLTERIFEMIEQDVEDTLEFLVHREKEVRRYLDHI